jgi:branched-chain amino acid transport system substrate-binding protein
MKRLLVMLGVFAAVTTATAAWADITFGVNISTTGPVASLGIPNKNALLLAPTVIAGQKIHYIILDDASDTTTAVQNVKRLISEHRIDLLLGPSVTPTSLAVIDTIAAAKTPMISYGSASAIVSPMDARRKWVFKTTPNDDEYVKAVVNHMIKKHVQTIALIAVDDPYGESWTSVTRKRAAEKGIKVLSVEKFQRNDTGTTAQALRAMKGNPDAILIIAAGTPAVTPHRALVERGYKGKIYQTGGAANADFLRLGGKTVEGAYLPAPPVIVAEQLPDGYPTKQTALEFLRIYEGKYGPGSRSTFAGHLWDAVKLLEVAVPVALKQAQPGTVQFREALRGALEGCKGVKGVSAMYTMSPTEHSGINQLGIVMIRIEHGGWKLDDYASF